MELDPQRLGESIPRLRLKASEAASEAAFALLDALWHGPTGLAIVDVSSPPGGRTAFAVRLPRRPSGAR